ncbi:MAG: hypothetical protein ACRCZJ_01050 [Erysipelotrichaceae bacterium]
MKILCLLCLLLAGCNQTTPIQQTISLETGDTPWYLDEMLLDEQKTLILEQNLHYIDSSSEIDSLNRIFFSLYGNDDTTYLFINYRTQNVPGSFLVSGIDTSAHLVWEAHYQKKSDAFYPLNVQSQPSAEYGYYQHKLQFPIGIDTLQGGLTYALHDAEQEERFIVARFYLSTIPTNVTLPLGNTSLTLSLPQQKSLESVKMLYLD